MDERRDHVIRKPLPWRSEHLTECGRPLRDVASSITVEELQRRLNRDGQQRTAFTVCMTCYHHIHAGWDVDPVGMIQHEGQRSGQRAWSGLSAVRAPTPNRMLIYELHAIAKLVDAHRGEFDRLVEQEMAGAEWRDRLAKRRKT